MNRHPVLIQFSTVEQSLYEICHHNIIYRTLGVNITLLNLGRYGNIKMQILDIPKKSVIILIGLGLSKIEIATENGKFYKKHC